MAVETNTLILIMIGILSLLVIIGIVIFFVWFTIRNTKETTTKETQVPQVVVNPNIQLLPPKQEEVKKVVECPPVDYSTFKRIDYKQSSALYDDDAMMVCPNRPRGLCVKFNTDDPSAQEVIDTIANLIDNARREGCTYLNDGLQLLESMLSNAQDLNGLDCGLIAHEMKKEMEQSAIAENEVELLKYMNPIVDKVIELSCINNEFNYEKFKNLWQSVMKGFCE